MRGSVSVTHHESQLRIEESNLTIKVQGMACTYVGGEEQIDHKSEKAQRKPAL